MDRTDIFPPADRVQGASIEENRRNEPAEALCLNRQYRPLGEKGEIDAAASVSERFRVQYRFSTSPARLGARLRRTSGSLLT